jgi:phospholipid/cholesterol/gamma-HCH transport system ATP-binding protein
MARTVSTSTPPPPDSRQGPSAGAIEFDRVSLAFDEKVILSEVSFEVPPGYLMVILGASGAGKSTILRLILGLLKPDGGRIIVNGHDVSRMTEPELMTVRADLGMVFQEGALFDSLTVRENVGYRLYEETKLPLEEVDARVEEVLGYVGLAEYIDRMPSELSGGQRRRVAIARALTSKPGTILYDEPTTGLDPITATSIDDEIVKLRDLESVTSIVVTHQLRDAFYIAGHEAQRAGDGYEVRQASSALAPRTTFMMLRDAKVAFQGRLDELRRVGDPYLESFVGDTIDLLCGKARTA